MTIGNIETDIDSVSNVNDFRAKLTLYSQTYGDNLTKEYAKILAEKTKESQRTNIVFRPTSSTTEAAQKVR